MHDIESPRTDDSAIEAEIKAKGLTAPRVTPADIETNIASEHYFTAAQGDMQAKMDAVFSRGGVINGEGTAPPAPLSLLTICVLVLQSGFTVTGESACASPENFDAELGRKIARANAVSKVWPLMGYALKERLHAVATPQPPADYDHVAVRSSLFSDPSVFKV